MNTDSKPLVTFVLFAYNQAPFIREAVQGAFSQTYSTLEIILSDDCSTDSTFEIMSEMAAGYRGRHKVTLNRNERNLGLSAHLNKVMAMSKGELIVGAGGDDVSYPERASLTVEAWEQTGRKACSIYGVAEIIDCKGENLGLLRNHPRDNGLHDLARSVVDHSWATGPTHSWSRSVFTFFGPLREDVVNEDMVIAFRSNLLGGIMYLERTLAKYRKTQGGVSTLPDAGRSPETMISTHRELYRRYLAVDRSYEADYRRSGAADPGVSGSIRRVVATDEFLYRVSFGVTREAFRLAAIAIAAGAPARVVIKGLTKFGAPRLFFRLGKVKKSLLRQRLGHSSVTPL